MVLYRRMLIVYCTFLLILMLLTLRVFFITTDEKLKSVADNQSSYLLSFDEKRGQFYDCNLAPLLYTQPNYKLAVIPTPQTIGVISSLTQTTENSTLLDKLKQGKPFLFQTTQNPLDIKNPIINDLVSQDFYKDTPIKLISSPKRYPQDFTLPHIIGYTDDEQNGVYGLEKVLDDFLTTSSGSLSLRYNADANGRALNDYEIELIDQNYLDNSRGVVLTIDKKIQEIALNASEGVIDKGAVVVMEASTGELKALVSLPTFDVNNLSPSLDNPDKPFVNRAFSAYNVGSTFKLCLAACAIEYGVSPDTVYPCYGSIDVGGINFGCHYSNGHGEIDLKKAIEISCNPYFVQLAQDLGGNKILQIANGMGFAKSYEFFDGYKTATGSLPTTESLSDIGQLANFSFGQGKLSATPIQMATMISVFTNSGKIVSPSLIKGFTDSTGTKLETTLPKNDLTRVISQQSANIVKDFMINVVENGSGKNANPFILGAGGKTASAQTGIYFDTPDGKKEQVDAWFCGFFPAYNPEYIIVVLNEGGESGSEKAAPVFKSIADAVLRLKDF